MRRLLLAVTVALACGAQGICVPRTRANLDVQKVAGAWYPMAVVASDAAQQDTKSAPLRLSIKELRPTAQDGLEITVRRWEDGSCVERKMLTEKTETPASFQIVNQAGRHSVPDKEDGDRAPAADQKDGDRAPVPAQEDGDRASVPDQKDGDGAPAADQKDGDRAPAADQKDGDRAPVPDQKDGDRAPVQAQKDGDQAPAADQKDGDGAPAADQKDGDGAPAADQKDRDMAPVPDQKDGDRAPVPAQKDSDMAPAAAQKDSDMAPAAAQKDSDMAPAADQKDHDRAPVPAQEVGHRAAALEGGKVQVLDTDYKNYMFLCLEAAAAAPAPAQRSLACQYLARSPKADKAAMEKFRRVMKAFSMRTSVTFTPAQAAERCRV